PFISSNKTIHHNALEPTYDPGIFLDTQHVRKRLAALRDANIWTTERFLASNTSDCHGQPINSEMSCTRALTVHEPCACRRREDNPDHAAGRSCGLETGQPSAQGAYSWLGHLKGFVALENPQYHCTRGTHILQFSKYPTSLRFPHLRQTSEEQQVLARSFMVMDHPMQDQPGQF
ncbi:hypothetical protein Q9233_006517, partial [Columba guinea]